MVIRLKQSIRVVVMIVMMLNREEEHGGDGLCGERV